MYVRFGGEYLKTYYRNIARRWVLSLQRSGRIVRFGNKNEEVRLFNYVTKQTFDSYLWQILETKQKAFFPILSGKAVSRTIDDVDTTALTYAEVKAIATGNPKIRRKMELEIEVSRLKILEQQYIGEKHNLQDKSLKQYPQNIFSLETKISKLDKDIEIRNKNTTSVFSMRLGENDYTDKNKALKLLTRAAGMEKYADKQIGSYKGFEIIPLSRNGFFTGAKIALKGADTHIVELSDSDSGNLTRIENVLNSLNDKRKASVDSITTLENQIKLANAQLEKPFEYVKELLASENELNEINAELDIGKEDVSNLLDEQEAEKSEQCSDNKLCSEEEVIEEEFEMEI